MSRGRVDKINELSSIWYLQLFLNKINYNRKVEVLILFKYGLLSHGLHHYQHYISRKNDTIKF